MVLMKNMVDMCQNLYDDFNHDCFGAPDSVDDHVTKAVKCAIEMNEALKSLNKEWEESEFL